MTRLASSAKSGATPTAKPIWRKHSVITWVSSLQRAPVSVTVPDDKAAKMSARLVMLLDPGTVMDT